MSVFKRGIALVCSFALLVCGCFVLVGCGEQAAATWSDGKVEEESVTNAITNMRTNYGVTTDSAWETFVKNKTYDTDSADEESDSDDSKESSEKTEETDKQEGTVADLRTYVINELVREQIIEHEIEKQGIQVSDEDVDAQIESMKQVVESQYMEGVFESYMQQLGYSSLDDYKEEVRKGLAQDALQEQVTGSTDDEDAWNEYVDGLVESANVQINPMPSGISYDVASSDDSESSGEDESTEATETEESENTDTATEDN